MIRSVLGKAVSTGASVLDRLGDRLNGEESEESEDELEHEADPRVAQLKERNRTLKKSVRELEDALNAERQVAKETSEKLAVALNDQATIDDLVDEYSKLSNEAAAQAELDASKLAAVLNRNEELSTRLQSYQAQILSLTDAEAIQIHELVNSGQLANDGARLFAALRAAKARQFELELDLNDTRARLKALTNEDTLESKEEKEDITANIISPSNKEKISEEQHIVEKKFDQLQARAVVAEAALEESRRHAFQLQNTTQVNSQRICDLENEIKNKTQTIEQMKKTNFQLETALKEATVGEEAKMRQMEERATREARAVFANQVLFAQTERDQALEKAQAERNKRRQVHNKLMEARGNIRVYCRCRPSRDLANVSAAHFPCDDTITISRADLGDSVHFEFDGVFNPDSTQEHVFEDAAKDLIISALDGFSVCIFAYGQTGSGKTFTMTGPPHNRGLNFRAIQMLFNLAEEAAVDNGVTYTLHLSILEIYNETVIDLLPSSSSANNNKKLEIHIASGECQVPGLERHLVTSVADVQVLLDRGAKHRSVGAHDLNDQSSRSHQIVTLHICGKTPTSTLNSKLHLVDLAGSERLAKTDAAGERLKEAQNINKSLSALGDVIAALSAASNSRGSTARHVPFRNSKLTFFLQDSLSGNSKALMFVNVSPTPSDVPETLCSLKFAARCRDTALGKAKRNSITNSTPSSASSAHRDCVSPESSRRRSSLSGGGPSPSSTSSRACFNGSR